MHWTENKIQLRRILAANLSSMFSFSCFGFLLSKIIHVPLSPTAGRGSFVPNKSLISSTAFAWKCYTFPQLLISPSCPPLVLIAESYGFLTSCARIFPSIYCPGGSEEGGGFRRRHVNEIILIAAWFYMQRGNIIGVWC